MTRVLDLTPEQEQTFERRAKRAGMDVDAYLKRMMEKVTAPRKRNGTYGPGYKDYWTEEDQRDFTAAALARSDAEEDDNV